MMIEAETKIVDALEGGQAKGEVETPGGKRGNQHVAIVRSADNASYTELGLSRQRVAE